MKRSAVIDLTGQYRSSLLRAWETTSPKLALIMLNPSNADAQVDDPTLRHCIGFAQSWGYGCFEVVNLFAYRTPNPDLLSQAIDPVGRENDQYLEAAVNRADRVVVGWGNRGNLPNRAREVLNWLFGVANLYCLGTTKTGNPCHPLYLKKSTKLVCYVSKTTIASESQVSRCDRDHNPG